MNRKRILIVAVACILVILAIILLQRLDRHDNQGYGEKADSGVDNSESDEGGSLDSLSQGEGIVSPSGDNSSNHAEPSSPSSPSYEGTEDDVETNPPSESPDNPADPLTPDENGIIFVGNSLVETQDSIDEESISFFCDKMKSLRETYLDGAGEIVLSVIPDKSWYASAYTDMTIDHNAMMEQISSGLPDWTIVEISDLLSLESYLKTDPHWAQDSLKKVAERLGNSLGATVLDESFKMKSAAGFKGEYSRFYPKIEETIHWWESESTNASVCDNMQYPDRTAVYDASLIETSSPYDVFLGGQTPILTITNPLVERGSNLVVFRDSYASSLVPLLLANYHQVTLVDLRYMVSDLLPDYVSFDGADVLFLYCGQLVNNSRLLR